MPRVVTIGDMLGGRNLGERPRLRILARCQDLETLGEIPRDVTHIACHEYRTLVRDQAEDIGEMPRPRDLW
jgi:hypothetical protein